MPNRIINALKSLTKDELKVFMVLIDSRFANIGISDNVVCNVPKELKVKYTKELKTLIDKDYVRKYKDEDYLINTELFPIGYEVLQTVAQRLWKETEYSN